MEEQGEKEIEKKNKGKLILDATVAPSDIKYPTDLGLLNLARKITEKLIDKLYKPLKGFLKKKPRTDRKEAVRPRVGERRKGMRTKTKKNNK